MSKEATELYRKWRPTKFKDVVGQNEAVECLFNMLKKGKLPHVLLLAGNTGVGKSTLAKIIRVKLGCSDADFAIVNCGSVEKPITAVREIESRMALSPFAGPCRVWLLEEVQALSRAQFAQQALLDILENTPSHVYFLLATTDPDKVIKAVRGRCTIVNLKPLNEKSILQILARVVEEEQLTLPEKVTTLIAENSEGSARKALVLLHQISGLPTEQDQLDAIAKTDTKRAAFDLVKALLWEKSTWSSVAEILKGLEGEDPEQLRRMVLACATTEILKAGRNSKWCCKILYSFEADFFQSGRGGLVRACYEVLEGR